MLADVKELRAIDASGRGIRRLDGIESCKSLEFLDLSACPSNGRTSLVRNGIHRLDPLRRLDGLEHLNLDGLPIEDASGIPTNSLKVLSFHGCPRLRDIDALCEARRLTRLSLARCPGVHDLTSISRLSALEILDLTEVRVSDFTRLAEL
jgi:Leucine-rich repeat (LRR) protein